MQPLSRLVPPEPDGGFTDDDVRSFAACERLLFATYRLSETGHRTERYPLFTDDTVLHIAYEGDLGEELLVVGKDAVVEWYERSYTARVARGGGPRVHLCNNVMWGRVGPDEVHSVNYMAYHEFPEEVAARTESVPRLLADCVHHYRRVDGRWLMSHKYYWVFFSNVAVAR